MKNRVTIARALKEKNRIAGRLAKARDLVAQENSQDIKVPRGVDVAAMYASSKVFCKRLVETKTAIALANQPIVGKIIELDEIKSEISYLGRLDVKEGVFVSESYNNTVTKECTAVITKQQVVDEIEKLQFRADRLQDEIDEFNALTKVEIDVG